jgi:anti-sigma B factor antagonist
MHLEIQQREKEGITVLDLHGRLVLGPEDVLLRDRILALLDQSVPNAILNLKEVSHIDTAALGTLVFGTEKFRTVGGKLVLTGLNPHHVSAADVLKLDTELEMYPDEQDAVNSFFPERAVPRYDLLQLVQELKARRGSEQTSEARNEETK